MTSPASNSTLPSAAPAGEQVLIQDLMRIMSLPSSLDNGRRRAEAPYRRRERESLEAETQHLVAYMRDVAEEIDRNFRQQERVISCL